MNSDGRQAATRPPRRRARCRTIANDAVGLSVDRNGAIVSLVNKRTGTELIAHPQLAMAWRLVVPSGRHTVDFVYARAQQAPSIKVVRKAGRQSLVISHRWLRVGGRTLRIAARFTLTLADGSNEILARCDINNRSDRPVDEVEFPVIGPISGPDARDATLDLVMSNDHGRFVPDVLHRGLPQTGRESNHFVREHETAFLTGSTGRWVAGEDGRWVDVSGRTEGLYVACHEKIHEKINGNFFFKLEKFPKEVPNAPAHHYPEGTPRWLRVFGLHVPCIAPGGRWRSLDVCLMPHKGDWHAGADRYSAWRHESLAPPAATPEWMNDFVGWTEILGKTYLGEVFHDYAQCADMVVRDSKVTGLNFVFYYGHSRIGAEGADFDHSPAPDLGGPDGFRKMVRKLHRNGIRIMLLDHFHRYVNRDVPEYRKLRLERYAVRGPDGLPVPGRRWWKETARSCIFQQGPTPEWIDMCPACKPWRRLYIRHVKQMVALGIDGLELDCFDAGVCWADDHGHRPGANMADEKLEFIAQVRQEVKKLNGDFVLIGETTCPEARGVLDGYYSHRYPDENGRISRYVFPELTPQTVLVGNYAYDQVNKALMLGIGVNTEIWGLRKTALAGCPELAAYIGQVTQFRRKYADILIRGRFRDTVGARVVGEVMYSVIEGPARGKALVLRNHTDRPQRARAASLKGLGARNLVLWRPFGRERKVKLPVTVNLKPYEAAVLLACDTR